MRRHLRQELAARLHDDWAWAFDAHQVKEGYAPTPSQKGRRALANHALSMLWAAGKSGVGASSMARRSMATFGRPFQNAGASW